MERAKPYLLTLVLLGLVLIVAGVVAMSLSGRGNADQPGIELIESETGEVYVDVGGAVESPGLYKLAESARINDALVAAGGLSLEADRNWVTQTLNLAAKVKDGDKIYIPFKGESAQGEKPTGSDPVGKKININTASVAELDTLWGVGPATAQKIIDNRPYASVEEVLSKKAVKSNVYDAIKDQISVY